MRHRILRPNTLQFCLIISSIYTIIMSDYESSRMLARLSSCMMQYPPTSNFQDRRSRMIVQPTRANVHPMIPIPSVMKRAKSRRRSVAALQAVARWQLFVGWSTTPYGGDNNRSNSVNQGHREMLCRKCNIKVVYTYTPPLACNTYSRSEVSEEFDVQGR